MNYNDITYDKEVQAFSNQLPHDIYNNTLRKSIQWSIGRGVEPTYARDLAIQALQAALYEYAQSKATTRVGRIGRFFARILSFINPKKLFQ